MCIGVVLATICGIEYEYNWFYQACTKCAGRIKVIVGRMFCGRCNQSRNVFPMFKLHIQVMDNTGSTSFILFDKNVMNYVRKTVQDLIDAQNKHGGDYPTELDALITSVYRRKFGT